MANLSILARIFVFIAGACSVAIAASNQTLVYQGRIIRPDGMPVDSGTVLFTLAVFSPLPSHCLLYSETQTVSMTGSLGMFSLPLGAGARTDGGSHSFNDVFVNGKTLSSLTCDSGTSYTGTVTEDREMRVSFNDAGTIVNLSAMAIKSVPFALQAHEVDGWGLNNLVKVSSVGSPTTFTTGEMANVKMLGAAACATNEILKWNGSGWSCSSDATGGTPSDAGYTGSKGIVAFDTDAAASGITVASGIAKLSNTGVTAATYGAATKVSSLAVNAQGRITSASEISISIPSTQLTQSGAAVGEVLKWNGSAWLPAADATGTSPGDATYAAKGLVQADTNAVTSGLSLSSGVISVNSGTGASQIVKLDASAKLPAVDGSALTNLNANSISFGTLPISRGGTGASTKTTAFDALSPNTTKGDLIVSDGTNNIRLPRGSDGQVLTTDSARTAGVKWSDAASGTVTSVTGGTGLTGGTITSVGTLAVDVGSGANQIVQLDAASKLPAVDGSALTNLSATQITAGTLPISRGGTGASSLAANNLVGTNGTGSALQAVTCSQNQVLSFDASGNYGCYNLSSIAGGTYFANGGNSFGSNATLGTNDNYALGFKTNNSVQMTLDGNGSLGIGTANPIGVLNTSSETNAKIYVDNYGLASNPAIVGRMARGTGASPGAILKDDDLMYVGGRGYGDTGFSSSSVAGIGIIAAENFTDTNQGALLVFETTPLGSVSRTERMRIQSNGNVGIGTVNPSAPLDVNGEVRMSGAASGYVGFKSPAVGPSVTWTWPTVEGSAGQFLKTDGSGNLSWASASSAALTSINGSSVTSQSFAVPGTSGTAPGWSTNAGTGVHTLNIPMASGPGVTAGLLSKTDYDTFNTKLGTSTSFSGDVSGTYDATNVDKIKGTALSISALTSGNFLKYNGSAWVNANLSSSDIPSLDASKITTGTLPVSLGGTGSTAALTNNKVMVSSGGAIVEGNGFGSAKAFNSFVVRDASGSFAAGAATVDSLILKGGTSGTLTMTAPASFTSYSLNWPAADGSAGQFLKTDGSGNLSWATSATPSDATYAAKGIVQFNTDAATSGISIASGVATVNFGTSANQIVKLDGSSRLPAVDGSQLTNLSATQITAGTLPISRGGTGASTKTTAFDALSPNTTKGDLIVSDGTNNIRLPRGSDGQVLTTDSAQTAGVKWSNAASGTVTSVTGGTGLTGGTITSVGTLAVDVGTGANQIVQLDASSKLPAVDGSALTNLSATQITSGTLPISRGGTGASSLAANNLVGTNGTGSALQAVTCSQNQVLSFDASGNYGCYNLSTLAGGTYFANGGNSFAGAATLGTNDANTLALKTNGTVAMTVDTAGKVGIGTPTPGSRLDVTDSSASSILKVTNNASSTYVPLISAYAPNLAGTQNAIFSLGKSATSWNSATLTFVYDANGAATNRLELSLYNTTPLLVVRADGNIGMGTVSPNGKLGINQTTTGSTALETENGGTVFWKVLNPAGGSTNTWNTANAIQYVGKDTGTSRSINVAGTVNANGADFAEWVDWPGAKPQMGSVVSYKGSYVVISSPSTAAFIGNDVKDPSESVLVAFAGQLPVLVRGIVQEGDLIIAAGDGTARAVRKEAASFAEAQKAVGTAWESSENPGLKRVNVAVGIGLVAGQMDIASLRGENAAKDRKLKSLEQLLKKMSRENELIKSYLCLKDPKVLFCQP